MIETTELSTRERILEASGAIFARDGFHRAGIRDICTCANCNVASVKYYFGDKLGLYRELMRNGVADLQANRPEPIGKGSGESGEQVLGRWLRQFLELTLIHRHNHPYLGHIMKHELREPTAVLDEMVQNVVRPIHAELSSILRRVTGQPLSVSRQTAVLILSMVANLETSRPLFERLGTKLPSSEKAIDKFAEELTKFVLSGVQGTRK
ncbi:MAG: TetR/AcrR family transcriptional regulator [Burkholderiales bacterium]|nr:TetR/AcrR family transcriptional regulator [Burkholderiales bacterium]